MRQKIIIDCDPGVDDLLTLSLASVSKQFDILAVTSIFGNMNVETTTKNASYILEQLQETNTIVAKGAVSPIENIVREQLYFHGKNGLKDIPIIYPNTAYSSLPACDLIIQLVQKYPKEVTIIAIGPLTNLALAIQKEPSIVTVIKDVIVMGGSAFTKGNVTAKAESNFYNDPKAVDIVLKSGLFIHMVGLDVTLLPRFYQQDILPILEKSRPSFVTPILQTIFVDSITPHIQTQGTAFHDPLTIAYLLQKETLTFTPYYMEIETIPGALCEGACVVDTRSYAPTPNVYIATAVNIELYKEIVLKAISSLSLFPRK